MITDAEKTTGIQKMEASKTDWETHRLRQISKKIKENGLFDTNGTSTESFQEIVLEITNRGKRREIGIFVAPHLLTVNALAVELLRNDGFIAGVFDKQNAYPPEIKLAVIQIICTGYVVHSKRQDLLSKYPEDIFISKEVRLKAFTKKYIEDESDHKAAAEILLKSEEMVDFFLDSKDHVKTGVQNKQMFNEDVSVVQKHELSMHEMWARMDAGIFRVLELMTKQHQIVLDRVSENTNITIALREDVSKITRPAPTIKLVDVAKLKIQNSVLKLFPKVRLIDKRKTGVFVLEGVAKEDLAIGRVDAKNYKLVSNVLEYSGLEQSKSELYATLQTTLSKKDLEIQNYRGEKREFVRKKFNRVKVAIDNLNKLLKKSKALCGVRFDQKENDGDIVILSLVKK